MSISGISSTAATGVTAASQVARKQSAIWNPDAAPTSTSPQDTFTSDFASILASVQSGDITSAQAALTKLQADQPPTDASYSPNSTNGSAPTSSASTDLQSLLQAVQGGDIGAAQKALSSLQSDVQADAQANPTSATSAQPRVSGHHHHHHAKPASPPVDSSTDTSTDSSTSGSTSATTSVSDTLA